MRSLLQLLRFPNVFSAWADILAGWLVARVTWEHAGSTPTEWAALGLLIAVSSMLYWAGMVLNDYVDREIDAVERPQRPIPSGQVSAAFARRLAGGLLIGGLLCAAGGAWLLQNWYPLFTAMFLAAAVVLYDCGFKATPLGPVVMGGCRWLNILLGMSAGLAPWPLWQPAIAAGPAIYIAGVTVLARGEAGVSPRGPLVVGWLLTAVGLLVLFLVPYSWPGFPAVPKTQTNEWLLLAAAMLGLTGYRIWIAIAEPGPQQVQQAVVQSLRSYVILLALLAFTVRDLYGALIVMTLLIPQQILGRLFYAT